MKWVYNGERIVLRNDNDFQYMVREINQNGLVSIRI